MMNGIDKALDIPGVEVEMTQREADQFGAFVEDALTEDEAKDTWLDEFEEENDGE